MDFDTYQPATDGRIDLSYEIEDDLYKTIQVSISYLPHTEAIQPDSLEQPLEDLYHGIERDSPQREETFLEQVFNSIDDRIAADHLQVTVTPQIEKDINHDDLYHIDSIQQTKAEDTNLFSED
ncbi:MAG: hypothetical protein SVU32_09125 [Candidatus Nanohaloarchaea archaeon]|nr:hypothetical protein [Candidatus Nanohaloarchaea archaeon]